MKKAAPKAKHSKLKIIVGLSITGLLIVALASWITIVRVQHNRAIAHERAQFIQADKDLDNIAAAIKTKFGTPATANVVRLCAYSSRDYGKGGLGCALSSYMAYDVETSNNATQLSKGMNSIITSQKVWSHRGSYGSTVAAESPDSFNAGDFEDIITHLNCTVSYKYYTGKLPYGYPALGISEKYRLLLEMICGGAAKALYYTIVH